MNGASNRKIPSLKTHLFSFKCSEILNLLTMVFWQPDDNNSTTVPTPISAGTVSNKLGIIWYIKTITIIVIATSKSLLSFILFQIFSFLSGMPIILNI